MSFIVFLPQDDRKTAMSSSRPRELAGFNKFFCLSTAFSLNSLDHVGALSTKLKISPIEWTNSNFFIKTQYRYVKTTVVWI